ncbi:transporter substrate-binding domain-containing protein [Marinobacter confluentis]|uniref:Transporter substrate-binding domain-containing protein n=1 Tax=Marinobacter confluentis TaxID=1697557 RepID=A0A4Z1C9V5_9GAMM|nr:PDC sensor domain-containing protein [Marinobacter confluentis]TGN40413.1 hypothetical protein E5Q11_09095 [Marinobacter confluentis]
MEHMKGVLAVLLAILALLGPAQAEDIKLYTFPAPPYQIVSETPGAGTEVSGLTVDTVVCSADRAGRTTRIHASPPRRAIQLLINSQIDGYFAVDPSTYLDQIASRTNPVSLEKWHLISLADGEPAEAPRMGAVIGSNEEAWLRSRGKDIFLTVTTSEQLIALLHRQRIDQALMDHRVLESLSDTSGLRTQFLRYVPLHVYFNKDFASRNPGFIDAFNREIPRCINRSFDLDESETGDIRASAYDLFRELQALIPMEDAIRQGPQINSLSEILNLDAQWQALAPSHYSDMARRVADQDASVAMAQWQKRHETLVTEVMLTNSVGTLVAMSQLTSDFWQGDEPKFERHIRGDTRDIYVSPIRYDASTSRFQVTVSMPIIRKGQWLPAGVLVIGLDVEQALKAEGNVHYLTGVNGKASP